MRRLFKIFIFSVILFVLIYVGLAIKTIVAQPDIEPTAFTKRGGTAVVITGAASRIAQEAALLEKLQNTGWLNNICFISGTSSGALNMVVLNAILENKYSWERYHSLLFNIDTDDIFIRNGRSIPVDNEPYRKLLTRVINDSLGYQNLGDLPFRSSVSIADVGILPPFAKTYRLCNLKINDESSTDFNLVEVLMASTAIPVIFPPARLQDSNNLPNSSFIDGGLGEDHLPVTAVLQFEKYRNSGVDTLIIVSRKSDTRPEIDEELLKFGNNDSRLSGKLNLRLENMAKNGFIKSMKELQKNYPELAERTYVYIPDFEENFPLLDFSNLKKQFDVTVSWAESHKPVPLYQYLAENDQVVKASK